MTTILSSELSQKQWEQLVTPAQEQIIDVLAAEIDPPTGEVLADDSPGNDPHVIRALHLAARALEMLAKAQARPPAAANVDKLRRRTKTNDSLDPSTLANPWQPLRRTISEHLPPSRPA
jgi:hypothetical protein